MATLTSLLNLSKNSLLADQAALNATANNVANQNVAGYTRQTVNWETVDSVAIGDVNYGQGVSINLTTTSARDRVLEQRVQQQTQTASASSQLNDSLNLVQDIFGVKTTTASAATTAIGTAIDSFFNSFSTLSANAGDAATRNSVLGAASNLAQAFNSASAQLQATSTALDTQVNTSVTQINSLLSNIAALDSKIAVDSPAKDAGALEDQRQLAITNLSQLIGLDQITTEHNGITLTTTSGALLVSTGQPFPLTASPVGGVTHIFAGQTGADITAGLKGGSLGGVLQARDVQIPSFVSKLDQLAFGIGTAVNNQNIAGLDGTGAAGQALFTLPGTSPTAAKTITLAPTVSASSIAAAATGEGATGSTNASALANLANLGNVAGQTAQGFYAGLLSGIGSASSAASADNTVQQAALTQLNSQNNAVSSVSLDEEAANLTQYQRSYQAAAKVFSIIDTLLTTALNLGVQSSFS